MKLLRHLYELQYKYSRQRSILKNGVMSYFEIKKIEEYVVRLERLRFFEVTNEKRRRTNKRDLLLHRI